MQAFKKSQIDLTGRKKHGKIKAGIGSSRDENRHRKRTDRKGASSVCLSTKLRVSQYSQQKENSWMLLNIHVSTAFKNAVFIS